MNLDGGAQTAGRFAKWARQKVASAAFGAFLAVLGVFTGFVGSIYTPELKTAVETAVAFRSNHLGVALFLVCGCVTAVCVFWRQSVIDENREGVQNRFDAAATEVAESIQTLRSLPEPSFLTEFNHIFSTNVARAEKLNSFAARLQGTTVVLEGFAALAQKFDGTGDARFAANLMLFLTGEHARPWIEKLSFFDGDPSKLDGLLALPVELAALSKGPDDKIPEFALPVPKDRGTAKANGGSGWTTLPGAPAAFSNCQFEHYASTSELHKWCEDFGDFTNAVKRQVREHFSAHGSEIAGFMCIPILNPKQSDAPLGILNIHWNKCARIGIGRAAELFAAATLPLQVILGRLAAELLDERPPVPGEKLSAPPPAPPA